MRSAPHVAESTLRVLLLALLIWLPLPFGSVIELAQTPLVLISIFLFAGACVVRLPDQRRLSLSLAYIVWTVAGVLLVAAVLAQVIPLPPGTVRVLSPNAHEIWRRAEEVSRLMGGGAADFPDRLTLSVAPERTRLHLLRLIAYVALFQAAFLLIRRRQHRLQFAMVLCATAIFEVLYGLQQLYRGAPAVWGWQNTKILNRVTGTYVNPNHYAHYLALVFPIALYLGILALPSARSAGRSVKVKHFLERGLFLMTIALITMLACLAGILVAQSRGALFALVGALLVVAIGWMFTPLLVTRRRADTETRGSPRRRVPASPRLLLFAIASILVLVAVAGLVRYFGFQQTVARFQALPEEGSTLVGRTIGARAALGIWRLFPLLGSGLGAFEDVVLIRQSPRTQLIFTHAHNDYAELLATTGLAGLVCLLGAVLGYLLLWRDMLSGSQDPERISRERRLFLLAGIATLTIVAFHALIDFNFFIPANAATAAAIAAVAAGAAAQPREAEP